MNYEEKYRTKRLEGIILSPIRVISDQARKLKEEGKPVIFFSMGEPDFNTPDAIKEAAVRALRNNLTHYSSNRGVLKLRREVSKKLYRDTGVLYNPDTEIIMTNSGAEAINNAFYSVINPGDEVILPTPSFINYECLIKMCGGTVIDIPLKPEKQFQLDVEEIAGHITAKTRLIVINNPCNPTGAVFTEDGLKALAKLAVERDLLVFSDEIYSNLVYENTKFVSIASFPGMKERTLLMNGFSKTYAMTGWRLGYLAVPEWIVDSILRTHQYSCTSGITFIQEGVAEAMNCEETLKEVEYMRCEFARRRVLVMKKLDGIRGITYVKPYGAFYIMLEVSGTGLSGEEFSRRLLEEEYVATVPCTAFGKEYNNFIRMSYAASEADILEGLDRIEAFVGRIPGRGLQQFGG